MSHKFLTALTLLLAASAASADCLPTAHRTTGTHYKAVTEQRGDVGQGLVISGQVLSIPDCTPVAGAKVAHWQADADGRYVDRLRAWLLTDAQGRYRFTTEWPNLNPPHIHFIVSKDGYETLETQWIGTQPVDSVEFNMVIQP